METMENGYDLDFAAVQNPYDFANPVSEQEMFAGRQQELDDINYYLDHALRAVHPIHLALFGDRASGKTSLLNMIDSSASSKGMAVVRVNLDETDGAAELAFFSKIFDSLFEVACESGAFGGVSGPIYDSYRAMIDAYLVPDQPLYHVLRFPLQFARAMGDGRENVAVSAPGLIHDLKLIQSEVRTPILIIFDECDVLRHSQSHLQKLRNIMQSSSVSSYMLVLTGTSKLMPQIDDVFSPMLRQFKKVPLLPFDSHDDTEDCVFKPLKTLGIENPRSIFKNETLHDIKEIHDIAGGRPYEIQLLCHFMFKRIQLGSARTMGLTFEVMEDVRTELESTQDVSLRPIIHAVQHYSRTELRALGTIGACCGNSTFEHMVFVDKVFSQGNDWDTSELNDYLAKFVADGVLSIEDRRIQFVGDDFDRVYLKYFARQNRVRRTIETKTLGRFLSSLLLSEILGKDPDILPPLITIRSLNSTATHDLDLDSRLEALDWESDPWSTDRPLASFLYRSQFDNLLECEDQMIEVRLKAIDVQVAILFIAQTKSGTRQTDWHGHFSDMCSSAARAGGELEVTLRSFPIASRDMLIGSILGGEPAIKSEFTDWHIEAAAQSYAESQDIKSVAEHIELSSSYASHPTDIEMTNNLGYLLMRAGEFDKAQIQFTFAIEKSGYNIAKYNFAIASMQRGEFIQAEKGLIELLSELPIDDVEEERCLCLVIPQFHSSKQELEYPEQLEPLLSLATKIALIAVQEFLNSSNADSSTLSDR